MRVLYIAPFPPRETGICRYAEAFKKCLENHPGVSMSVLQTHQQDDIAKVKDCYQNVRIDVLANLNRWSNYDIIHVEIAANSFREYYYAYFLTKYAKNIPLFLTIHDSPHLLSAPFLFLIPRSAPKPVRALRRLLDLSIGNLWDKRIIHSARGVFVLTKTAKEALFKRFKDEDPAKFINIPHISFYATDEISRLKPHDYVKEIIEILFFGYLIPGKGIEDLVKAYALVLKESNDKNKTLLRICGDIPNYLRSSRRADYLDELRGLAASLKINGNVHFDGYIPEEKVNAVFKEASILVIPYTDANANGASGPMLSGMTEGLPLIVSDSKSRQEDIIDKKTGLTFRAGDTKALAIHLRRLIDSPEIRSRLGSQARQHIISTHSWKNVAEIARQKYQSLGEYRLKQDFERSVDE